MSKEQESADEHWRAQKERQDFADRARQRARELQESQISRQESFVEAALGFLNVEVDTGLTLARIAAQRSDAEERVRQCRKAREAYDSVVKHLSTAADASSEELDALNERIAKLRQLLESLGEKF